MISSDTLSGKSLDQIIYTYLNQKYINQQNHRSFNESQKMNKNKLMGLSQRIKEKLRIFDEKKLSIGFSISK